MELRPKFHITALKNWINDPNGVIRFNNQYHVFFQHHPYGLKWGPMHWGHVISDDLLNWKHLSIALTPGDDFDKDGCFSGTSFVHDNKLYVVYTGFIDNEDKEKIKQQQCLAYSEDGIHFTKLGLIIGEDNLPKEYAPNDFRDPFVYFDDNQFIMLVAARKVNGKGNILKYVSKDLKKWDFVCEILPSDSKGVMIECPDYIEDMGVLMYCEQYHPYKTYEHRNANTTIYEVGKFDENNKFIASHRETIDYGFDFYATQVILGDNILIAWMDMWERNEPSEQYGFAGSLTIPRHISIKNGELYQTPVLPNNGKEEIDITNKPYVEHSRCGFYKLEIEDIESLNIKIRKGPEHQTSFYLKDNEWIFDRSKSGVPIIGVEKDEDSINGIRRMPYHQNTKHEIYMVLDEFSVELFIDGKSMTSLIYPDLSDDLLEINIKSKNTKLVRFF